MIRRDDGSDWLLISQVDHAHLAGEVAAAWGNDDVAALPVADLLIPAIRDHDDGWHAWESLPGVDAASGRPRNFTEMPLETATALWSASIATCASGTPSHAEAMRRYGEWLAANGAALTCERAAVLEAVLQFRGRFGVGDLRKALRGSAVVPTDRVGLLILLSDLTAAGVVRCVRNVLRDRALCEPALPSVGQSPLGGIWVSRHFCWLAEKARQTRSDYPDDVAAAERFLAEQAAWQSQWAGEAVRQFAGEHLERLLFAGFRYVQFFDQVSLWLCTAAHAEPTDIELPSGRPIRFTPRTSMEIVVDPWPLSVPMLELTVPARRIPARRYTGDDDLHRTLRAAPTDDLRWTLSPRT